jgi:hypothetical protein
MTVRKFATMLLDDQATVAPFLSRVRTIVVQDAVYLPGARRSSSVTVTASRAHTSARSSTWIRARAYEAMSFACSRTVRDR